MTESAEAVGLSLVGYEMPDLGSWGANVNQKPRCILQAMKAFPANDVLYVDADAAFNRMPIIDWDDKQFAAYFDVRKDGQLAPCGGTLWFRNSNMMRAAVSEWAKASEADTKSADDWVHLASIIKQFPKSMIHRLPPAWCWHEPTMRQRFPGANPIVIHSCVGAHDYLNS